MRQEIIIPLKPISYNSLIRKNHWAITKIADEWKEAVFFKCKAMGLKPVITYPAQLSIVANWKSRRRHDIDSLYVKAAIDALVLAGILEDDDLFHVNSVSTTGNTGMEKDELILTVIT